MENRGKAIAIIVVIVAVAASATAALMVFNKSADLLNSEFRVIVTGSMDGEPRTQYEIETIPVDSLVAIHKLKGDAVEDVKVGDVIGFYSPSLGGNIYHRVISVDSENRIFTTKGDANTTMEYVGFDEANGIVVNVNHPAGQVIAFVKANVLYLVAIVVLLFVMAMAVSSLIKLWKE